MQFAKLDQTHFLVRLERGEEIIESIKSLCKIHDINNAALSGLGSVENPTLAHYRVDSKKYSEKKIEGIFELINLTGNIALFENDIFPHIHVTIGDEQMHAFGGHLVHGNVSATAEIIVTTFPSKFEKKLDEAIGLKLFNLPK